MLIICELIGIMKKPSAILFLTLLSIPAFAAEGLRTLPDTAGAMGMVGGRLAVLDDASVTRHNPATLTDISDTLLTVTFQPWHGKTDFAGALGQSDSMIDPWKPTGSLYMAHSINEDLTLGFGVNAPFGVSISWPDVGAFRYFGASDVMLQTIALNPALGLKINDDASIGVGLDIYRSDLMLKQRFPWALTAPGLPDGTMDFEGNGWGIGAYFGINFDLGDRQRLAVAGRLPVSVDYEGTFTINNIPGPGAALPTSPFNSEIEHPGSVGVGYSFNATEQLTIGVDFEWIQNSTHDDVPLDVGANQPLLDGKTAVPLAWGDSISIGLGIEYDWTEEFTFRAGYLYSDSPMSSPTWNPAIPADDRHIFSLGFGYTWDKVNTVDFAYSLIHMSDSTITNNITPAFNGVYSYAWDVLTLSYSRRF